MKDINIKTIFLTFLSGIIGSILFHYVYHHKFDQRIGRVRPKVILENHLSVYGKKIGEKDQAKYGALFANSLESSIEELNKDGLVLLVSDAVVGGVPDYTEDLEKRVEEKMKAEK